MSGQGEQGEGEAQEDVEMIEVDEQTQGPVQQPPELAVRYLRATYLFYRVVVLWLQVLSEFTSCKVFIRNHLPHPLFATIEHPSSLHWCQVLNTEALKR